MEVGVGGVGGVRCGLIGEVGCSHPLTDNETRSLQAAAAAQQITGTEHHLAGLVEWSHCGGGGRGLVEWSHCGGGVRGLVEWSHCGGGGRGLVESSCSGGGGWSLLSVIHCTVYNCVCKDSPGNCHT